MPKDPVAEQLRQLADVIESRPDLKVEPWEFPHPDTQGIIDRRRVEREQFAHSVPVELDLRTRLNKYCLDHGEPGAGNVVAGIVDAMLRHHGYPPPSPTDDDMNETAR